MAFFPEPILTIKGQELYAAAMAGEELKFLYIAIGSGIPNVPWNTMTSLVNEEFAIPINFAERRNIHYYLEGHFNNTDFFVSEKFNLTEWCLYAKTDTLPLAMICYAYAGENYSIVPPTGSSSPYLIDFPINLKISSALKVSAIIELGKKVQSDWIETDTSNPAYILNKPYIISLDELDDKLDDLEKILSDKLLLIELTYGGWAQFVRNGIDMDILGSIGLR